MADFQDRQLRAAYEKSIKTASVEDLATLAAAIKPLLAEGLRRVQELANSSITELDPLPTRPTAPTPKADE